MNDSDAHQYLVYSQALYTHQYTCHVVYIGYGLYTAAIYLGSFFCQYLKVYADACVLCYSYEQFYDQCQDDEHHKQVCMYLYWVLKNYAASLSFGIHGMVMRLIVTFECSQRALTEVHLHGAMCSSRKKYIAQD